MRFAGKFGALKVGIQQPIIEYYATGTSRILQSEISAQFKVGGLQPFEREFVLQHWAFNGLYQEQDEVTTVQPDYRIGLYDSLEDQREHGWSDEVREQIEQELLRNVVFDNVLLLPRAPVAPPWPRYDDFRGNVGQLMKKLDEEGHDLESVLLYEQAMQNRPPLVEALQARIAGGDLEPEVREEEEVLA